MVISGHRTAAKLQRIYGMTKGIASVCKQGPLLYHKDGIRIPYKGDFKNNPHTLLLQQEMIREN